MTLKDLPQTFRPSANSISFLFITSFIFVIGGIWIGSTIGYLCAAFFSLGIIVSILKLFPQCDSLTLTPSGFEYISLFRRVSVNWDEVSCFGVYKMKSSGITTNKFIGFNYLIGHERTVSQKLSKTVSGFECALPDTYGFKAEDLLRLMNDLQQEFLRARAEEFKLMMSKIVVFGNSGSGKSTLAKLLARDYDLAHLDLDSVAWQSDQPTVRRPLQESHDAIRSFMAKHESWVIEGCYASLLEFACDHARAIYFLNIGVEQCIENCRDRPWEPHKYPSKEAQDRNLSMLIEWVTQYTSREDDFSYEKHRAIYDQFSGAKKEYRQQQQISKR